MSWPSSSPLNFQGVASKLVSPRHDLAHSQASWRSTTTQVLLCRLPLCSSADSGVIFSLLGVLGSIRGNLPIAADCTPRRTILY